MLIKLTLNEHFSNLASGKKVLSPAKPFEKCITLFHYVPEIGSAHVS